MTSRLPLMRSRFCFYNANHVWVIFCTLTIFSRLTLKYDVLYPLERKKNITPWFLKDKKCFLGREISSPFSPFLSQYTVSFSSSTPPPPPYLSLPLFLSFTRFFLSSFHFIYQYVCISPSLTLSLYPSLSFTRSTSVSLPATYNFCSVLLVGRINLISTKARAKARYQSMKHKL